MKTVKDKTLKVVYAAGPGDVIGTYRYWINGKEDPSQVAATYSSQFFDVCKQLNAEAYVISTCKKQDVIQSESFLIEHRPVPFGESSGLLYHLGQMLYGLWLIYAAVRFQADVFVVAEGTTHWFLLSLLPWFGIRVVPSIHCTLWPKFLPKRKSEKLLLRLARGFFTKSCTAIMSASDDISMQVDWVTKGQHPRIIPFLPTYQRSQFTDITAPTFEDSQFRVLYVGRIEEEKGVFDVLEIAKQFAQHGKSDIMFDLCGQGSRLEALRTASEAMGLQASFVCHGHCDKSKMRQMFSRSHAVIVPTRTSFNEGFNQAVIEAVLSGRPVITSSVCPSAALVKEAVVEVTPDDVDAYASAILKLRDDNQFYEEKRKNCAKLQTRFYDSTWGWAFALEAILDDVLVSRKPVELPQLIKERTAVSL